jgi:hypothetical protein
MQILMVREWWVGMGGNNNSVANECAPAPKAIADIPKNQLYGIGHTCCTEMLPLLASFANPDIPPLAVRVMISS